MTGHTIDRNNDRHKLDIAAEAWKRRPRDRTIFKREKPMDPEALAEELSDKLIEITKKQLEEKKAEKFGDKSK